MTDPDRDLEASLARLRPAGETAVLERALAGLVRAAWADPDAWARLAADPAGRLRAAVAPAPPDLIVELRHDMPGLVQAVVPVGPVDPDQPDEVVRVLTRARVDPDYAAWLAADPRPAVEDELGLRLPDGLEVAVLFNAVGRLYLILPADPSLDGELSDLELEAVAAGKKRPRPKPGPGA